MPEPWRNQWCTMDIPEPWSFLLSSVSNSHLKSACWNHSGPWSVSPKKGNSVGMIPSPSCLLRIWSTTRSLDRLGASDRAHIVGANVKQTSQWMERGTQDKGLVLSVRTLPFQSGWSLPIERDFQNFRECIWAMNYLMCGAWIRCPKLPWCKCGFAMRSYSVLPFKYGSTCIYLCQLFYLAINEKEILFKRKITF